MFRKLVALPTKWKLLLLGQTIVIGGLIVKREMEVMDVKKRKNMDIPPSNKE